MAADSACLWHRAWEGCFRWLGGIKPGNFQMLPWHDFESPCPKKSTFPNYATAEGEVRQWGLTDHYSTRGGWTCWFCFRSLFPNLNFFLTYEHSLFFNSLHKDAFPCLPNNLLYVFCLQVSCKGFPLRPNYCGQFSLIYCILYILYLHEYIISFDRRTASQCLGKVKGFAAWLRFLSSIGSESALGEVVLNY